MQSFIKICQVGFEVKDPERQTDRQTFFLLLGLSFLESRYKLKMKRDKMVPRVYSGFLVVHNLSRVGFGPQISAHVEIKVV